MKNTNIGYFPAKTLLLYLVLVIVGCLVGCNAPGFLGMYVLATTIGIFLQEIGDRIPVIYKYLGGGAFIAIFGSAVIRWLGVLGPSTTEAIDAFVKNQDYIGLVVGGLICGSILTMDRDLLIKAGTRYFVPIIGGIVLAFGLTAVVGAIAGYGWREAILFVALPIMGGGTSAGAVPTALAYEAVLSHDQAYYLTLMMPAVVIGNAVAVVAAGVLDGIGKKHPASTGNGKLMKLNSIDFSAGESAGKLDALALGRGIVGTGIFYIVGKLLAQIIPIGIHYYAWTILACAVVKIANLVPKSIQEDMSQWYVLIAKVTIPAVYFTVGYTYMDLQQIIDTMNITYLVMIVTTLVGCILGTWFLGKLVGFYPVESSITAGLCMANMGGSGDVAVLGAANRMELMPFAQISSRLGGALIIITANILAPIIGAGL